VLTDQDTAESTTAEYSQLTTATVEIRWDEKAGLRRDAVGFQVIDMLEAQEIKETDHEEASPLGSRPGTFLNRS